VKKGVSHWFEEFARGQIREIFFHN
jgi:hypothetical protein